LLHEKFDIHGALLFTGREFVLFSHDRRSNSATEIGTSPKFRASFSRFSVFASDIFDLVQEKEGSAGRA